MARFYRTIMVWGLGTAVLVGACGADNPTAGPPTTTTSTAAPDTAATTAETDEIAMLTATDVGVTAQVIRLGVVFPDLSVIGTDNGDLEAKYQIAIDAENDSGGIHGRTIELHFSSVSPLDDAAFDARCAEHTEDIEVFAVVGVFLRDQALCYAELHNTPVINHFELTDEQHERATAPMFSVPTRASRAVEVNVQALVEGGYLAPGQAVAIHGVEGAQEIHEQYRSALENVGVVVVSDTIATNTLDIAEIINEAATHAERWRTDGATAVLGTASETAGPMFSGSESVGLDLPILLPTGLDRPPSVLTAALGTTEKYHLGVPLLADGSAVPQWANNINGVRDCAARFEAASGETIYTSEDGDEPLENLGPTMVACELIDFFTALAIEAGPELTRASLAAAGDTIGEFSITGVSVGSLGPDKPDYSDTPPQIGTYNADLNQYEVSS